MIILMFSRITTSKIINLVTLKTFYNLCASKNIKLFTLLITKRNRPSIIYINVPEVKLIISTVNWNLTDADISIM